MTDQVQFTSSISVQLVKTDFSDTMPVIAARTSTAGSDASSEVTRGLINSLMKNRHDRSPFEHMTSTWQVTAPIFVWREHHRHRMCVTGDTNILRCQEKRLDARTDTPIEVLWENWHLGVKDNRPSKKPAGKIRFRKRTNDYVVDVQEHVSGGGENETVCRMDGPFPDYESAKKHVLESSPTEWRRRKLLSCRKIFVPSVNEETGEVVVNRVVDIVKTGVRKVFRVETELGHVLKCTSDHPLLVPSGDYRDLTQLGIGDEVCVLGFRGVRSPQRAITKVLRQEIGFWTAMQREYLLPNSTGVCYICEEEFETSELEIDHVVPVGEDLAKSLDIDNLKPACKSCHREKTSREQQPELRGAGGRKVVNGKIVARIRSIEECGEEEVYDLEVESPHHNFVANGFVVHNCSYSEESARYRQLRPLFYLTDEDRKITQIGKPMDYDLREGSDDLKREVNDRQAAVCYAAYANYQELLSKGVAREVARNCLPVNIMSTCMVTMNSRGLMNFLSLRHKSEDSSYDTNPLHEIDLVAQGYENTFKEYAPLTHEAFVKFGRVAP